MNKLISDTTDRLSEEISTTPEFENMVLSPYPFYITNESGGGQNPLYISWMWQRNLNAREYADDFAKNSWGKGAQWKLQTQMNPKGGGPVKVVGGTEDTIKWVDGIIKSLETQPEVLEHRKKIVAVQKLGEKALLLIGEELG